MTEYPPLVITPNIFHSEVYHPEYLPMNRVDIKEFATPTTTTSTTYVMLGLKKYLLIQNTGEVLIHIICSAYNTLQAGGVEIQLAYGTGVAPNSGDAATGTVISNYATHTSSNANATGGLSVLAIISGLVRGTKYWFDIQWDCTTAGGTATIDELSGYIKELID